MELRIYLDILAKRWWLILAVTLAAGLAAFLYVSNLSEVYEGSASYILRPHSALTIDDSTVRAIDTLSRRIEIATTYAEVAGSELIKNRAVERIGLSPNDSTGLSVTGRVVPGTNVLEITLRGPSRDLVKQFGDAVNQEFISYVNGLYDVFELGLLDEPRVGQSPAGPDGKVIVAGAMVAGVAFGSVLALIAQYWEIVTNRKKPFDILDSETGTFNRDYLTLRLREEISRAQNSQTTFSLALLALKFPPAAETWTAQYKADMLRRFIAFIGAQLREEDILCRYDTSKFALLLPVLSVGQARDLLTSVAERLGAGGVGLAGKGGESLQFTAGISAYVDQESVDEILNQVEQALDSAGTSNGKRITMFDGGREAFPAGA